MEEENNNKDKFIVTLLILFIVFLIAYITKEAGYYEIKAYKKAMLTEENIKKFEQDIDEGKNITKNNYVVKEYRDYSNTITDLGYNIGKLTESIMNDGIKKTLKVLNKLFYE